MAQHDAQGLGSSADQVDATDGGGGMGGRSEEFTREISQLKLSGSSADTEARMSPVTARRAAMNERGNIGSASAHALPTSSRW